MALPEPDLLFWRIRVERTMSSVRVRESPFREGTSEWDRRLDDMLDDLENSTNANNNTTTATAIALQQA